MSPENTPGDKQVTIHEKRGISDLIVLLALSIVVFALCSWFDLYDRLQKRLGPGSEKWQADEWILVSIFVAFGLAVFSFRRWKEARSQLLQRQKTNVELAETAEQLRKSEERYRQIIENIDELIYTVQLSDKPFQGKVTFVSKQIVELIGYQPEEFIASPDLWMQIIHPEDIPILLESRERILIGRTRVTREYRVRHKRTGEYVWLEDKVVPHLDANGKVIGLQKVARDITARKKAELALVQNQTRLAAIVSNEPECVKIVDLDGNLQEMNPAGLRMIAADSLEQVAGKAMTTLIHPDDRMAFSKFHTSVAQGSSGGLQFRIVDLHGDPHWMESSSVPLRDSDGKVISVLSVTRDITERKMAADALQKSEERYRSLITQSSEGIFIFDPQTRKIQEANPVFLNMLGYTKEEIGSLTLYDIIAASRASIDRNVQTLMQSKQITIAPRQYQHKNGTLIDVEVRASVISYGSSRIILVNVTDITERKRAEALQSALYRIAEKTAKARDLFEFYTAIHSIIGQLMNTRNFYIALYDSAADMLSFPYFVDDFDSAPPNQRPGRGLTAYVLRTGQPLLATPEVFEDLVRRGEVQEFGSASVDWLGVPLKTRDSVLGVLVVQSYTQSVRLREREKEVLTFISQHIASALERKRAEETIRHQAYHDVLTLLPNRILFKDQFSQALSLAQRNKQMVAMMFLDLDRFKTINDTLGHATGDRLLQSVAQRLSKIIREGDTIARLGGDEFLVLVSGIHHVEDAAKVADKLLQAMRPAFDLDGQELHITTSIGISLYPHDGDDAETLLKNADTALYRAKDQGRNTYQLYTPAMNARAYELLAMENNLRRALENQEFVLHFQPQISVHTGKLVGMEALVRWNSPDGKLMYPSSFISLCEDTGLIVPLGEWVLRTACEQNRKWQESGHPPITIAVNLSARQFQQRDLMDMISRVLADSKLAPEFLELELTESVVMQDPNAAVDILGGLRGMGIQISIDDFGTGYSSLSYLRRFPIHRLKIDQSFVRDCMVDNDDAAIVAAIISMARSLKLKVIAEGVETEDQLDFLRKHHCDIVQGFLISRPVPADIFISILTQNNRLIFS